MMARLMILEEKRRPGTDWNLACAQFCEQVKMMDGCQERDYDPDDYIVPLWESQKAFNENMVQRQADYDKIFGAGAFAKDRADQKEWQAKNTTSTGNV